MKKPIDDKCLELARHFLGKLKGVLPEDIQECAEFLQDTCEKFARAILGNDDEEDE